MSGRRPLSLGFDNIYLTYPVYFFHLVVLSWLVLKLTDGKPTFPILFVAGTVFFTKRFVKNKNKNTHNNKKIQYKQIRIEENENKGVNGR